MGVVDDQQIRSTARDRASHAGREILAAVIRLPPARRLRVGGNGDLVKHLLIDGVVYQVLHLPAEPDSQLRGVGGLDDLEFRIMAH